EGANPAEIRNRKEEVKKLKRDLNEVAKMYRDLRLRGEARGNSNFAFAKIDKLDLRSPDQRKALKDLLALDSDERAARTKEYLQSQTIEQLAVFVAAEYEKVTKKAAEITEAHLNAKNTQLTETGKTLRRELSKFFYD